MNDDDQDFREVYTSFEPRIRRYLALLTGETEIEALIQVIFAKVRRALKRFKGESQLATWVYRIATKAAIDWMRSSAKRIAHEDASRRRRTSTAGRAAPLGVGPRPRDTERLGYRAVAVLSELEGFTNNEIAEMLNLQLETVKKRLHTVRILLDREPR